MIMKGLSLDQAPPLHIPFLFFYTGLIMGMLASITGFFYFAPMQMENRWEEHTLLWTHWFLLGSFLPIFIGALFQIFPVLFGIVLKRPQFKALLLWVLPVLLFLSLVHLWVHKVFVHWIVYGTMALLLIFLIVLFVGIRYTHSHSLRPFHWFSHLFSRRFSHLFSHLFSHWFTHLGVLLSFLSFSTGLVGALILWGGHWDLWPLYRPWITQFHLLWMLLGGITLMFFSISWKVLPMFFVTPSLPSNFEKVILFGQYFWLWLLSLSPLISLPEPLLISLVSLWTATGFASLWFLLWKRKKKTPDHSLWFWHMGIGNAIATSMLWFWVSIQGQFSQDFHIGSSHFGILMIFALFSFVFGMLYKIIPFLCWFHLQPLMWKDASSWNKQTKPLTLSDFVPTWLMPLNLVLWGLSELSYEIEFYKIFWFLVAMSFALVMILLMFAHQKYKTFEANSCHQIHLHHQLHHPHQLHYQLHIRLHHLCPR